MIDVLRPGLDDPGVVIKINAGTVEIRNLSYGRVIIRHDSIDAVAIN